MVLCTLCPHLVQYSWLSSLSLLSDCKNEIEGSFGGYWLPLLVFPSVNYLACPHRWECWLMLHGLFRCQSGVLYYISWQQTPSRMDVLCQHWLQSWSCSGWESLGSGILAEVFFWELGASFPSCMFGWLPAFFQGLKGTRTAVRGEDHGTLCCFFRWHVNYLHC